MTNLSVRDYLPNQSAAIGCRRLPFRRFQEGRGDRAIKTAMMRRSPRRRFRVL